MTTTNDKSKAAVLIPESDGAHLEEKKEFTEQDLVTVLHGWGRLAPDKRHYIDRVSFEGGVARNVPYSIARHWEKGTRPDGKPTEGKVKVYILHNDADEGDFIKVTGITPMEPAKLAAMLSGSDLDAIFEALGARKAFDIAQGLQDRIARHNTKAAKQ